MGALLGDAPGKGGDEVLAGDEADEAALVVAVTTCPWRGDRRYPCRVQGNADPAGAPACTRSRTEGPGSKSLQTFGTEIMRHEHLVSAG